MQHGKSGHGHSNYRYLAPYWYPHDERGLGLTRESWGNSFSATTGHTILSFPASLRHHDLLDWLEDQSISEQVTARSELPRSLEHPRIVLPCAVPEFTQDIGFLRRSRRFNELRANDVFGLGTVEADRSMDLDQDPQKSTTRTELTNWFWRSMFSCGGHSTKDEHQTSVILRGTLRPGLVGHNCSYAASGYIGCLQLFSLAYFISLTILSFFLGFFFFRFSPSGASMNISMPLLCSTSHSVQC